jgi:hypothetical protein
VKRKYNVINLSIILLVIFLFSGCAFNNSLGEQVLPVESIDPVSTEQPTIFPTTEPSATSLPATLAFTATATLPDPTTTPTPNPYITPTPAYESLFPPDYNPLTGLTIPYPENLLRSPLMVKISNYPREIRPQAGLSKADIVFEYYIGASMNRFLAVFYGEDAEWAGPIRSGRLIDAQLAMNYHAALVYGGADARVNDLLTLPEVLGNKAVDTRFYEQCPPLCGTETHSLEGLYVNTAGMSEDLFNNGYDVRLRPYALESIVFSETIPSDLAEETVDEVEIVISEVCRSRWSVDESLQS